jgi:glucose dehydrogenase
MREEADMGLVAAVMFVRAILWRRCRGSRYSQLMQINRSNVAALKIAWEYHTGDVSDGSGSRRKSAFETTPIVANGTM